jgi:hypothetical protein
MNLALVLLLAAGACPVGAPVPGTAGLPAVAKVPAEQAMRQNAEGKALYRQERWEEARKEYRAALSTDPAFLGAQLNLACSFSRQGRYADAADEAATLIRTAYVPWQREVREALDLGILQDQKDYAKVTSAMSESARRWGALVGRSILFLARTKPPVKVAGEGPLVLSLAQEVFAWNPETGRYFQVTADDGHVLGFIRSADKRRVAYLVGGKLVRERGRADALRGLGLRVLEIPTMSLGPVVPIPGEVAKVELGFAASPEVLVTGQVGESAAFRLGEAGLERIPGFRRGANLDTVMLTTAGVQPGAFPARRPGCSFELVSTPSPAGLWRIEVRSPGKKPFMLDARYGAGLPGLPFPDGSTPAQPAQTAGRSSKHDNQ